MSKYSERAEEITAKIMGMLHDYEIRKEQWEWSNIPSRERRTLYPNLVAQIFIRVPELSVFCREIGVTPRLMSAVIEEGEPLNGMEMLRAKNYLNRFHQFTGNEPLTFSYFASPQLSILNIARRKDWLRLLDLEAKTERARCQIEKGRCSSNPIVRLLSEHSDTAFSEKTISRLKSGLTISYAEFYYALDEINQILLIRTEEPTRLVRDLV